MQRTWTDEFLIQQVKESISFLDLIEKLDLKKPTNSIRRKIKELNLDTNHWYRKMSIPRTHKFSLENILLENSPYFYTSSLKKKLFDAGIFEEKCYECNLTTWNNKNISLQLHHINGISTDNRIENLTILCPNCHSQTDSYSGKNILKQPKAKEYIRYKCSHCDRLSTNGKIITCRKCMIKYHLGIYKSKFNEEQINYIIIQYENKSVCKLAKELKSSTDAIIKVLKDNNIHIRTKS